MLAIRAKQFTEPYLEEDEEILLESTVPRLIEYWSVIHFTSIAGPKKLYGFHEDVCVFYDGKQWVFKNVNIALASPKLEGKHNSYTMTFSCIVKNEGDCECG